MLVEGKAIIWASYTHDIQQIASALRDRFGPEAVAPITGKRPKMSDRRSSNASSRKTIPCASLWDSQKQEVTGLP